MNRTWYHIFFICTFIVFFVLAPLDSAVADEWVTFKMPDQHNIVLINKLLYQALTRPGAEYEYSDEAASTAHIAWIQVDSENSPYLFVMLQGDYCGSGGCPVYGFRKIKNMWNLVYYCFGGEGIKVLSSVVRYHKNLRQYESDGASVTTEITMIWDGLKYHEAAQRILK